MASYCPFCRKNPSQPPAKPGEKRIFPFCSERCKEADLGHWAAEKYSVPMKEGAEISEEGFSGEDVSFLDGEEE